MFDKNIVIIILLILIFFVIISYSNTNEKENFYFQEYTDEKCKEMAIEKCKVEKKEPVLQCMVCSDGTYAADDHTHCVDCPPGFYCKGGIKKPCIGPGEYSWDKCSKCHICKVGTYASKDHTKCIPCPPGFSCTGGLRISCGPGSYSPGSAIKIPGVTAKDAIINDNCKDEDDDSNDDFPGSGPYIDDEYEDNPPSYAVDMPRNDNDTNNRRSKKKRETPKNITNNYTYNLCPHGLPMNQCKICLQKLLGNALDPTLIGNRLGMKNKNRNRGQRRNKRHLIQKDEKKNNSLSKLILANCEGCQSLGHNKIKINSNKN